MDEGETIARLDGYSVAAIDGKGIVIVDGDNHYWIVLPAHICESRPDDSLAEAYREATS